MSVIFAPHSASQASVASSIEKLRSEAYRLKFNVLIGQEGQLTGVIVHHRLRIIGLKKWRSLREGQQTDLRLLGYMLLVQIWEGCRWLLSQGLFRLLIAS